MKKEYLFVMITGILSGTVVFGGQVFANWGLSLFELATLPYFLVVLFLLPFILLNKKYRIQKKHLRFLVLYGVMSIFLVLTQFGAVILGVPVTVVVLLLYTQPLWTILFSKIFMKEKITKYEVIACILVLIGVILLVNPIKNGFQIGWGSIVALLGGIFLSLWVIVGSYASKRGSHPITIKFCETFFMILFLALLYPLARLFIHEPTIISFSFSWPLKVWFWIIMFNLFTQTISHILFYRGLQKVPSAHAGIILLLEPVSAAVLAAIFLHQSLTLPLVIGGVCILIANYIIIRKSQIN